MTLYQKINFDYVFSSDLQMSVNRDSNKLLVTGLPDSVDEDHLEMFFEHTKRQGGGPVKGVQLYPDNGQAVVEFEETDAVQRVLNKQPIKMLGTTVTVERYEPYLDKDETLKSIEIGGIEANLVQEIADMKLKHNDDEYTYAPTIHTLQISDSDDEDLFNPDMKPKHEETVLQISGKIFADDSDDEGLFRSVKLNPSQKQYKHFGIVCDGCEGSIYGIRYRCKRCNDFDFCSSCKNNKYHNPKHTFQTIRHPSMH